MLKPELVRRASSVSVEETKKLRQENESKSREMQSANACETVFEILKDRVKNRVSINKILSTIEASGIQLNDPRLTECMRNITTLQRRTMKTAEDAKSSFFLDKQTFTECVRDNVVMLMQILQNDFVIKEFKEFSSQIREIFYLCKDNKDGSPASYIPQLARFNPEYWACSICTIDGQRYSTGDYTIPFCLQSTSKPLNYAMALTQLGSDQVHSYVGYEPSGISFNSIQLNEQKKPHNPMINSGAIIISSLIESKLPLADRFDHVMKMYKDMAGGEYLGFNNPTFLSERQSADRNFALAYYMNENKCFPAGTNLRETLDFYFQLCSIEVTCESAAVIAGTLANGGICPLTGEPVLTPEAVRDTLSLMHSCGMYDYSGQFAFKCGLPAKSGVSGIILLVIPNLMGIALWSPPLDKQGNSCRGIQFCKELVTRFNFHNYDSLIYKQNKLDPRRAHVETQSHEVVTLLFSAYNNDITALRRSFLQGCQMGQADYDGRTALHVAAAEGHLDVVVFLIENCQEKVNPRDRWGFTPLAESERFSHPDVSTYLKSKGGQISVSPMDLPQNDSMSNLRNLTLKENPSEDKMAKEYGKSAANGPVLENGTPASPPEATKNAK